MRLFSPLATTVIAGLFAFVLAPDAASACVAPMEELETSEKLEASPEDGRTASGAAPSLLNAAPEGVSRIALDCGGRIETFQIWTLAVDSTAATLGVRDDPLFAPRHTGPLVAIADAEIGDFARVTVMTRAEALAAPTLRGTPIALGPQDASQRVFGTICDLDAAGAPLDCAVGGRRIKMRADPIDADRDGFVDARAHEISIYDGANRLQVVSFLSTFEDAPLSAAATWLEVLAAVGAIDLLTENDG